MAEIVWTARAEMNLQDIYNYIASSSTYYADRTVKEIISQTIVLLQHPLIGKIFYNSIYTYRRLLYKRYMIIYRIENEHIFINAILHQQKLIIEEDFI